MVISFGLLILIEFVPTESSVVKSLEMIWVPLDSVLVIFNGHIKLSFFSVGEAPVVIEVGLVGFYGNGL